jgi:tetratricopeptide (TPR) repeat protein
MTSARVAIRRTPSAGALGIALPLLAACASTPETDPRYRPVESVLEVIAVLRLHIPDDTYRFEAARDFTGRNVYRSSLLRLESLERVHDDALRAGYMDGVIAFAKGRSLERLRAFDLASSAYRLAAERDEALRIEALRSADVCDALKEAEDLAVDPDDMVGDRRPELSHVSDPDTVIGDFETRNMRLSELAETESETHYLPVVLEEFERSDTSRASYFASLRKLPPEGDVRAIAELRRVVTRHPESKYRNRHMIALANLYVDIAEEYVEAHPPESLHFDATRFRDLTEAASQLYETVANQDGTPEKLEASRRLEAFLAFALRIDSDRFTP